MELASSVSNLRAQVCVIMTGLNPLEDRKNAWSPEAEEVLQKLSKQGISLIVIGPRPTKKFGTKKTVKFLDRHDVVGLKELQSSRSNNLELRVLSVKSKSWVRIRTEACIVVSMDGIWPSPFEGWTSSGVLTQYALGRWLEELKWIPGREFIFFGSSNQVLRTATELMDRGVQKCYVVESSDQMQCWRAYADRFIAKGGRILAGHKAQRLVTRENNSFELYLNNQQGTLILQADTLVLASQNSEALGSPEEWKRGLFHIQKRYFEYETPDEEKWLDQADWKELYLRVLKFLEVGDRAWTDGSIKQVRESKKQMLEYRKPDKRWDFKYSGKILERNTLMKVVKSKSVPKSFVHAKPKASLECFEELPCTACMDACPESAIVKTKLTDFPEILENKCAGCGACVAVCPAGVAVMIQELPDEQKARYFLPDDTKNIWKPGKIINLLNRKGDQLGTGKVVSSNSYENGRHRLLEIEATNIHLWEARNFGTQSFMKAHTGETFMSSPATLKREWVTINGTKRLAPTDVLITTSLWQMGIRRFEDAFFCKDGSCKLCEVEVDSKKVLACQTVLKAEDQLTLPKKVSCGKKPACPCKDVAPEYFLECMKDGVSEELFKEMTGFGMGPCHGRWCLQNALFDDAKKILRPRFDRFEQTPWKDIELGDLVQD